MTKGWCPVDDRIVDGRNGTCPECGTPLVDLTARPRSADESRLVVEEEETDPSPLPEAAAPAETSLWPEIRLPDRFFGRDVIAVGPAAIAAILVAAVVASFLVGFAIPRGRGGAGAAKTTPAARSTYTVKAERTSIGGVALTLETFAQRGRRITARISVPVDSPLPVGGISNVEVVTLSSGGEIGRFGMAARATTTGFILDGSVLERADVPVTGFEIASIDSVADTNANFLVDLSRVWPASSGPRAGQLSQRQTTEDRRTIRLLGVVGWPDRIEIGYETTGARVGWFFEDRWTLTADNGSPIEGSSAADVIDGPRRFGSLIFRDVPRSSREVVIGYSSSAVNVSGGWRWSFTGG